MHRSPYTTGSCLASRGLIPCRQTYRTNRYFPDMSNPDHWNSLASSLGAPVPAPAPPAEEKKPAAQVPSPPKRPAAPSSTSKPAERREADWSQLASQLGLAPTEPPPASSAQSQPPRTQPTRVQPPRAERPEGQPPRTQTPAPRQRPAPREAPEPPKRPSGPPRVAEEFVAEEIGSEEPIDAELVEEDDRPRDSAVRQEDEERTGRKRRRRRRGGRRSNSSRSAAEGDQPGEVRDEAAQAAPLIAGASTDEGPGEAAPATEDRKGRPKRRRRRGSGRNRDKPRARSDEFKDGLDTDAEPESEDELFAGDDEQAELAAVASESDAGDDEGAESQADKNSHRAIPAWEEAIGFIVSVNMENRAKNPKSGPPRGRGRGRGNSPRGNNHRRPS
jgi:hypothetical protein